MSPQQAAELAWEEFERTIHSMSREDYAEACEELACTCSSSADAVREELRPPT